MATYMNIMKIVN